MEPYRSVSDRHKRRRVQNALARIDFDHDADVIRPAPAQHQDFVENVDIARGAELAELDFPEGAEGDEETQTGDEVSNAVDDDDDDDFMSCISDHDPFVDPLLDPFIDENDECSDSDSDFDSDEDQIIVDNLARFDDSDDENDESGVNLFPRMLAQWAALWGICHNALDALLCILRKFPLGTNLPKTARTLLKTPRTVRTRVVAPGSYSHIGILKGIKEFLSAKLVETIPDVIDVFIGADGLPIAKSSGVEFWPILGMITLTGVPYVFTIGLYQGIGKPASFNEFYDEFVDEVHAIERDGFEWAGKVRRAKVRRFTFDAPARASSLMIKGHTGYHGCGKCEVEGDCYQNRVVFLNLNAQLRTDESFRSKRDEDHHHGTSILEDLDIDMVKDVPLDPMHLIYLGVMRKLLLLWLKGPLTSRLPRLKFNNICEKMVSFSSWIPRDFARKSRSLLFIARFKATEFRQFLNYTGPVVLAGNLPDRVYKNFLVLHCAVRILSNKKWCIELNDYAFRLLKLFIEEFTNIYSAVYVSYNVHNLIHLPLDCITWGSLESFSAFPFENYLGSIKRLLRKCHKPLQQIVKRIQELSNSKIVKTRPNPREQDMSFRQKHYNGPLVDRLGGGEQFKVLKYGPWHLSTKNKSESCVYIRDGSIVVIENFLKKKESSYIIGRKYEKLTDLYSYPLESSKLNIHKVDSLSELNMWPVNVITCKALRLPLDTNEGNPRHFAVFPLMMQEF